MSSIHPETAVTPIGRPDIAARTLAEVAAMNRAFLDLITDPAAGPQARVLGLDAAIVAGLRALSSERRALLADVPLLLADFALLSPDAETARSYQVADDGADAVWLEQVHAFANRLLASCWHLSRGTGGIAGFCLGLRRQTAATLAAMSFAELSEQAESLCGSLRARHAGHPTCWPDLIRLAAGDRFDCLSAARLGMIPLTVASLHSAAIGAAAR